MNLLARAGTGELPEGFSWHQEPEAWEIREGVLTVTPRRGTDFFRPPSGTPPHDNAALLYTEVRGDFTAIAKVKANLRSFGDAGALTVRSSPTTWAKLCIERSPIGDVSIVSVVTRGVSDDSNGELLDSPECFLRIARRGALFAMHHSLDGSLWRFTRVFDLDVEDAVMVGIHAQAPYGDGCSVEFGLFEISNRPVADFRSGE